MNPILVLDNYDSFTYNLVQLLRELGCAAIEVRRNDQIELAEAARFAGIVLSPGPGLPSEAGIMPELVRSCAEEKAILGICLGHQCIGEVFGARLVNLESVVHGKSPITRLTAEEDPLFAGLPSEFPTGRYHSWVVERSGLPDCLQVTAEDQEGRIMALRHRRLRIWGVQFHPESVLTPLGPKIIENWLTRGF